MTLYCSHFFIPYISKAILGDSLQFHQFDIPKIFFCSQRLRPPKTAPVSHHLSFWMEGSRAQRSAPPPPSPTASRKRRNCSDPRGEVFIFMILKGVFFSDFVYPFFVWPSLISQMPSSTISIYLLSSFQIICTQTKIFRPTSAPSHAPTSCVAHPTSPNPTDQNAIPTSTDRVVDKRASPSPPPTASNSGEWAIVFVPSTTFYFYIFSSCSAIVWPNNFFPLKYV